MYKSIVAVWLLLAANIVFSVEDSHSVESIEAALKMEIPEEVVIEAQNNDDWILEKGSLDNVPVYLVTDARLSKIKAITKKLLSSLDKDQSGWVVRVLDTRPPQVNAFVTGGKYIYVFTGFIEQAQSDDEIAFVIAHEIGHSFLKQNIRKKNDTSQNVKQLLELAVALDSSPSEDLIAATRILDASYSQKDEQEADAIAVILTTKSGFDAMRGIDFFTRSKKQMDESYLKLGEEIEKERTILTSHQQECARNLANFNNGFIEKTPENANSINQYCAQVEKMRVSFNNKINSFNAAESQAKIESFYSSHPADQSRIASIAAAVDYVEGVRKLDSLEKYEQMYRVYQALSRTNGLPISLSSKNE